MCCRVFRQREPIPGRRGLPPAPARPLGGDPAGPRAQRGALQAALHQHAGRHHHRGGQGWKLLSCSQCQELGQRANLAPDWFFVFRQPIRSQVSSLTQLLTLTTTQKFPSLLHVLLALDGEGGGAGEQLVGQHAHAPPVHGLRTQGFYIY